MPRRRNTDRILDRILIANRGEIAVRIISTCKKLDLTSIAIYTEADATSQHVVLADESALLRGGDQNGYMDIEDILRIGKELDCYAVIPGYGFLSENVDFAAAVQNAGLMWIGPDPDVIEMMGLKHRARELAVKAGVPVVPGTGLLETPEEAVKAAEELGYPIMLKATGGGGGMGLVVCESSEELHKVFLNTRERGLKLFKNGDIFLEKYYPESRHIEVQIFGNGVNVVHFGERECSIQRRHQKIIEECPSPFVTRNPHLRKALTSSAVSLASSIKYKHAGTVEFLVDDNTGDYFFLEMNTRLQVEHGITELCYNIDLVELMFRQVEGEMQVFITKTGQGGGIPPEELKDLQKDAPDGAAMEVRLYAENPAREFAPAPGLLQFVDFPTGDGIRVDTWVKTGQQVSPFYDPLLAKIMVKAEDRNTSIEKMKEVLEACRVQGVPTNQQFLKRIVESKSFNQGTTLTNFLTKSFSFTPCGLDVISAGSYTTIQDLPGRVTKGHGIPRSGPMDDVCSQVANLLVGNAPTMELLEMTVSGPELLFHIDAVIAICGAEMSIKSGSKLKPMWTRLKIQAGEVLSFGEVDGDGCRVYLAIKGGFPEIPSYLDSKSTTPSLKLGGIQGRQLIASDFLALSPSTTKWASELGTSLYTLPPHLRPTLKPSYIPVMPGPHDSPDYIQPGFRKTLYSTPWKIGHNSSRTGVRLIGPSPEWSRKDGGEGGAHPSNVMDYGYPSPGGINWTGDEPVVFCVDSPSLGGFLCSSTVVRAGLWKLGQVKPGDAVRFKKIGMGGALKLKKKTVEYLQTLEAFLKGDIPEEDVVPLADELAEEESDAVLKRVPAEEERPAIVYRQCGDQFILVEMGNCGADVVMTGRIRLLTQRLNEKKIPGLIPEPNISSITIEYTPEIISQAELVTLLHSIETDIPAIPLLEVPCREIRLPIVFDGPALQDCVNRYMETARPSAAYLPDNISYVQKNNGLRSREAVFETTLQSPYLTVAVGFLIGLPILLPLNPLSRLVAQKYNPSRVSTPGGTVGIGGSLLAIYPTEQPGGYMLLAQTLPVWDTFGTKPHFTPSRPWLFEPFDVLTFYKTDVETFQRFEKQFQMGQYQFDIRESVFDLRKHIEDSKKANQSTAVIEYKRRQAQGIKEMTELENKLYSEWKALQDAKAEEHMSQIDALKQNDAVVPIVSPINANVWKVLVQPGDKLEKEQVVAILEAMKMELPIRVESEHVGRVVKAVASEPGSIVSPGDAVVLVEKQV